MYKFQDGTILTFHITQNKSEIESHLYGKNLHSVSQCGKIFLFKLKHEVNNNSDIFLQEKWNNSQILDGSSIIRFSNFDILKEIHGQINVIFYCEKSNEKILNETNVDHLIINRNGVKDYYKCQDIKTSDNIDVLLFKHNGTIYTLNDVYRLIQPNISNSPDYVHSPYMSYTRCGLIHYIFLYLYFYGKIQIKSNIIKTFDAKSRRITDYLYKSSYINVFTLVENSELISITSKKLDHDVLLIRNNKDTYFCPEGRVAESMTCKIKTLMEVNDYVISWLNFNYTRDDVKKLITTRKFSDNVFAERYVYNKSNIDNIIVRFYGKYNKYDKNYTMNIVDRGIINLLNESPL
ncbi:MAG: hypothetical protein Terrestrivirus1_351 [Terrestrivirus sp.]|uniref:Uncharacterized protein n=1 Tax=Terrestrivirus sp. TaxID=2487775 RepID=A0A3G4ZKW6_9VIRU|nr:MAG: hypothetical protein Terrestrivirus1_351 [Terrestrivirus sp.]